MIANNRENAVNQLVEFINSDSEKVILLKGTHQFAKHTLVMDLVTQTKDFKKGIFRSNSLQNISTFLSHAGYKGAMGKRFTAGKPYNLSGTAFYFDSLFTRSTWGKSPSQVDFALVYPMDSFCEKNQQVKDELLDNLLRWKNIKKVFIVTWTDLRHDYDWLSEYVDRTVIYDAEEEDPAYHQRVLDLLREM
jgi:hypothetical protein